MKINTHTHNLENKYFKKKILLLKIFDNIY